MTEKMQKTELFVFLIGMLIAGIGLYYLSPAITGFAVKESSYADDLNLVITSSGNHTWLLGNIGGLKSVKIDGSVTNYGKASVYIESNGVKYLIFDSEMLNESKSNASNLITGFVVDEQKKEKNKKPQWIGSNEFLINGATSINLSQQFADDDGDILIYSASDVEGLGVSMEDELAMIIPIKNESFNSTIDFTASDGIDSKTHTIKLTIIYEGQVNEAQINATNQTLNETQVINETMPINFTNQTLNETTINETINKQIAIDLAYKSGSIYDSNDNGEESVNGIVDLTVEGSLFNWDADKSRLCARWEVYSAEDGKLTTLCYGNNDCCAFVGLLSSNNNWNATYYAVFGKDGAGLSNIISSQVIYYDVNLSAENLKSDVYLSEWGNLSVKFFEEEKQFSDVCIETCDLSGLNESGYSLIFERENDAVLRVDKIKYNILADIKNNPPVLLQNFSDINMQKNDKIIINLSQYFADPDGDALSYGYYKTDNITILFEGNTAIVSPDGDAIGSRFTFITANDSESFVASNIFVININEALIADIKFFEIVDNANNKLAVFDSLGSLKIKGALIQNTERVADENDFSVQNLTGGFNFVVTNPEGDVLLKGSLSENQTAPSPTPNSFIIQDANNETVAYADSAGSLFLKGTLTEHAIFG